MPTSPAEPEPPPPPAALTELTFEEAVARVEEIVGLMETDRLPLADMIARYEEGTALLQVCRARIDDAQQKVDLITRRGQQGAVDVQPFAGDETPTADSGRVRSKASDRRITDKTADDSIPF